MFYSPISKCLVYLDYSLFGLNFWLHINRLPCVGGMKSDMPVQDVDCFLANHSFYIRKYVHCTLAQGFYLIPVSATGDAENLTFSETRSV